MKRCQKSGPKSGSRGVSDLAGSPKTWHFDVKMSSFDTLFDHFLTHFLAKNGSFFGQKRGPKMGPSFGPLFWPLFMFYPNMHAIVDQIIRTQIKWSKMGPKMTQKRVKKGVQKWTHFLTHFWPKMTLFFEQNLKKPKKIRYRKRAILINSKRSIFWPKTTGSYLWKIWPNGQIWHKKSDKNRKNCT